MLLKAQREQKHFDLLRASKLHVYSRTHIVPITYNNTLQWSEITYLPSHSRERTHNLLSKYLVAYEVSDKTTAVQLQTKPPGMLT